MHPDMSTNFTTPSGSVTPRNRRRRIFNELADVALVLAEIGPEGDNMKLSLTVAILALWVGSAQAITLDFGNVRPLR